MFEKVGDFFEEQCRVFTELDVHPLEYIAKMYRFQSGQSPRKRNRSKRRRLPSETDWTTQISTLFVDEVILAKEVEHIDECNDVIEMPDVIMEPVVEEATILSLDATCYEKIFSWLSVRDLHAFGQTCKTMQKVTGEFFQENYPATPIRCENDGTYSMNAGQISGFISYIEKVSIFGSSTTRLRYISANCDQLKRLHLDITLTGPKIKSIKQMLGKMEVIEIENFTFTDKLFKRFLKQCTSLKRLAVRDIHQKTENKWLQRKYPHLVHFELTPWEVFEINELQAFFEQNPQVRSFSTNANCLWVNRNIFIGSDVQLDDLAIEIDASLEIDIGSFCSLLDALFEQSFYKRLHLYVENVDQKTVHQMAALHALVKLYVANTTSDTDLSCLVNLEELGIHVGSTVSNLDAVAKGLINLERVYFYYASSDHILPFIQHSPKLKRIKVRNMESGEHYDGNILYMYGLSKERSELEDAHKITIYLEEDLYLNTKWTIDKTHFDHINIERGESFEWSHHFRHYLH